MKKIATVIKALSGIMYWIAGASLVSIVLLTVTDVILRRFRMPIDFAFEIVVLLAAVVISFSLPRSTLEKGHIITDFLVEKLSRRWKRTFLASTRIMAVFVFAVFGWRVAVLAAKFGKAGQTSPILELPEHYVTYAVAFACFVECFALIVDLFEGSEGGHA
jgi:TRAP-type C4-dicarboxylate transport system permease small subunit